MDNGHVVDVYMLLYLMNIEQVVHITDAVAQVGRRPHGGGGIYLAAWESHHHLDTVP